MLPRSTRGGVSYEYEFVLTRQFSPTLAFPHGIWPPQAKKPGIPTPSQSKKPSIPKHPMKLRSGIRKNRLTAMGSKGSKRSIHGTATDEAPRRRPTKTHTYNLRKTRRRNPLSFWLVDVPSDFDSDLSYEIDRNDDSFSDQTWANIMD